MIIKSNKLKSINISNNNLSGDGIALIVRALLLNENICYLDLRQNNIKSSDKKLLNKLLEILESRMDLQILIKEDIDFLDNSIEVIPKEYMKRFELMNTQNSKFTKVKKFIYIFFQNIFINSFFFFFFDHKSN